MNLNSAILSLTLFSTGLGQAAVNSFSDINYWVGTGANQSALVIDFQTDASTSAFAWGYRWDEPTDPVVISGADMLLAIAAADPNLDVAHGGSAEDGFFVTQITYESAFGEFSATSGDFINDLRYWNYHLAGGTTGVASSDPDYDPDAPQPQIWTYPNAGTSVPTSWEPSKTGASGQSGGIQGRLLADGSWDAWTFGEFGVTPGGTIAAAPEPSNFALLFGLATVLFAASRRNRRNDAAGRG